MSTKMSSEPINHDIASNSKKNEKQVSNNKRHVKNNMVGRYNGIMKCSYHS